MINKELIAPKSIVVVGGSQDTSKPGGNVIKNLIDNNYKGRLYVVNPKADQIQGVECHKSVSELPEVDLAIIAIAAHHTPEAVEILVTNKNCRAVIIFSAGFHEESEEGAALERRVVEIANKRGANIIGPNCIGLLTPHYAGLFTKPIPPLDPKGVEIISGSGATALFIIETAIQYGLRFSSLYSLGNSAQIGVEEILEYLDESFHPEESSLVKLLYIESITNPKKLLKHSQSLIRKGAKIAAIKSGYSEAGSRAASSHTGAMASSDKAVTELFEKAGIIRCYSRNELVNVGAILTTPPPKGDKIAIITHAGGPAVMLTDILSAKGLKVPPLEGEKATALLEKLYKGSSVANPIDFLATGTADQLGSIIDACENDFDLDAMAVIFGSPGLTPIFDVYQLLLERIKNSKIPIYPILPSLINVKEEIELFQKNGGVSFPDESLFGEALAKVLNSIKREEKCQLPPVDLELIRSVIENSKGDRYLSPQEVQKLLDAAGIERAKEEVVTTLVEAKEMAQKIGFPLVMKVVGPIHKSDVGGVVLNVSSLERVESEFERMIKIPETTSILLQSMLTGRELFIGAKREDPFGHLIMCGLGGIFVEAIGDITTALSPISKEESKTMIQTLRGYKLIEGTRGEEGVNQFLFSESIRRVSALCEAAPEIFEMDLNPLLGNSREVVAVDARIRVVREE